MKESPFTKALNFVLQLRRECPQRRNNGKGVADHTLCLAAAELIQRARRHHNLAELACERELNQRQQSADATNERKIEALVKSLNPRIKCNFGGDPRGATVKLLFPSGAYNSMGGKEEGWCVPTEH